MDISMYVNSSNFAFPGFHTEKELDQARENAAALAGYESVIEAVKGVPRQYRCPGEDRPDADTDMVVSLRRLLRDGPMRNRSCWTGDEEDAAWVPALLRTATALIQQLRADRFVVTLVHIETARQLATDVLCADTVADAIQIRADIDAGKYDDEKLAKKSEAWRVALAKSNKARALKLELRENQKSLDYIEKAKKSYVRELGEDQSVWPEHINEWLRGLEARLLPDRQIAEIQGKLTETLRDCRENGIDPDADYRP